MAQSPRRATVEDVIDALRQRESTFLSQPSIYLEFVHEREYMTDEKGVNRSYKPLQIIEARKGPWLLSKTTPTGGSEPPSWFSWKDRIGVMRRFDALTIRAEPPPELGQNNHYAYWQGIDFYKGIDAISTVAKTLTDARCISDLTQEFHLPGCILADQPEWTTTADSESIDGFSCVVIQNEEKDKIWLDPKLGYACRRREMKDDLGRPVREWQHSDFKEFVPGLWLPKKQTHIFFFTADSPKLVGTPRLREKNRLVKASFALLQDTLFDVPIPEENGIVIDTIRDVTYELHPHEMSNDELIHRAISKARIIRTANRRWQPGAIAWGILTLTAGLTLYHHWRGHEKQPRV